MADSRSLGAESPAAGRNDRWLVLGVCLFLAAIIWVVFGQTLGHEFVNFDDGEYVYENPAVARGLKLSGIIWAFTHVHSFNWHPLTWMSHMLDCQWYGLNAGGHHLTNILLHTATAILLFLVLRRMTGFLWRSAFVAAVFAIHPLRVESVAWVAERKDVLSGLFFMLTLGAYTRYAQSVTSAAWQVTRKPAAVPATNPSPVTRHPSLFYGLVLLFFALGLMSKPMLVTLPLVLLLLDYWPLERFKVQGSRFKVQRLLLEKLPLLGLAVASCVVTIFAQNEVIQPFENMSFPLRVGNALISYVAYLGQMFWPSGLAVLYPFTAGDFGVSKVLLSVVLLAGITAGVFVLRRRCPCILTGWLWYLIMLAPVIGIVRVGSQARADRYTYLPQIGLYVLLTWALAELCAGWRHRRVVLGGGSIIILVALILCARAQTAYWRNSESLWTHTLACTSDNLMAHNNLGAVLLQKGRVDEAITHFQTALQINPGCASAHYNFGMALLKKGRVDEAMVHFQTALQINPDYAEAHNNFGIALLRMNNVDEAMVHFQKALEITPDYADAHNNLGSALLQKGKVDEAITQFQTALQIKPDSAEACYNLGNALFQKNNVDEAIIHYQKALQIKPDYADAHNNLGNALLQKGRVDEAMVHLQTALQIKPDSAEACYNLGNALLQMGKVDEAIIHYQKALQIKPDYADAHNNLGSALLQKGKVGEAMVHFQTALQINPDSAEACYNLGNVLLQKGKVDEAITHYQKALQIKPDFPAVLNDLAWLLATCPDAHLRDGVQAVQYAGRACELTHYGVTLFVGTLAAAYAEAGRYDDAMAAAQKACVLATAAGERELFERNQKLLVLYRDHQPYHEADGKVVPTAP
jgi:tetratricopeptide (TPR) repeat protein